MKPYQGKPKRRRSHAYRLRRAVRRRTRLRRIRDSYHDRMQQGQDVYSLWEKSMFRVLALNCLIVKMGGKP